MSTLDLVRLQLKADHSYMDQAREEIFAPRVQGIVYTTQEIRQRSPDEKVLIVSGMVMMLDVVHKGLRREAWGNPHMKFAVGEYNGMAKPKRRAESQIRLFVTPRPNSRLLHSPLEGLRITPWRHWMLDSTQHLQGARVTPSSTARAFSQRLKKTCVIYTADTYPPVHREAPSLKPWL